ncbi:ATP-binding protein [Kitasatospora misakiensis]|uniref:ATP-binding protein n=1 Tax=Kitasatospora misakiensis TaxID=67330 RepID=A0ABW0X015_9ACTN
MPMPMPSATRSAPGVDRAVRSRWLPLSARPGVIAEARAFTTESLAGTVDRAVVGDVVLLVSELVANAVRHAGGPDALLLVRERRLLRVEVTDRSPRPPRIRYGRHPTDAGGLGLFLLARLSRRWGWYRHGPGKVVWFEVDLPPR